MSHYWRHPALPWLEIRNVVDGRAFSHALHAHDTFSIGAIVGGCSTYLNGDTRRTVARGDLVLMNPGAVHACNPLHQAPWAYHMFYVDTGWLAQLLGEPVFVPLAVDYSDDPKLFSELVELYRYLVEPHTQVAMMHNACAVYFSELFQRLGAQVAAQVPENLGAAAQFIQQHCTEPLSLADIGAQVGLSPSYLIRAFKARYGLTPHGYLVDCRLRLAREGLRHGQSIADVAAHAGFADQSHLQRLFKRTLAATPGQYRR